jgi:hypothetical protein
MEEFSDDSLDQGREFSDCSPELGSEKGYSNESAQFGPN